MAMNILIHFLCAIAYISGAIWGIVEGADYIINHDPANWNFLIPLIGGIVGAFVNMFFIIFKKD